MHNEDHFLFHSVTESIEKKKEKDDILFHLVTESPETLKWKRIIDEQLLFGDVVVCSH